MLLVLLALVPGVAIGGERLAVLELQGDLPANQRRALTDATREGVVDALRGRVTVMTRENMEVMLTDMGLDASCVEEGACEVETARNLGADYVISGEITPFGDQLVCSLKLHETAGGSLVDSERANADDAMGLLDALPQTAAELVGTLGPAAPVVPAAAPAAPRPVPKPEPIEIERRQEIGPHGQRIETIRTQHPDGSIEVSVDDPLAERLEHAASKPPAERKTFLDTLPATIGPCRSPRSTTNVAENLPHLYFCRPPKAKADTTLTAWVFLPAFDLDALGAPTDADGFGDVQLRLQIVDKTYHYAAVDQSRQELFEADCPKSDRNRCLDSLRAFVEAR